MSDQDNIKALVPVICPSCGHTSVVELSVGASLLDPDASAEALKGVDIKVD